MKSIEAFSLLAVMVGFGGCYQSHRLADAGVRRDTAVARDTSVAPDTSVAMDAGCRRVATGLPNAACPSGPQIPDPEGLLGACCYRTSNARCLDGPQFRMAALSVTEPSTLANPVVRSALNQAMDEERFNWLLSVSIEGSRVSVEAGNGLRNPDPTFSFSDGDASPPGDPNRWDPPLPWEGMLVGENLTTSAWGRPMRVAVLDDIAGHAMFELPLTAFEITHMSMTEGRSCVGARESRSYTTMDGSFVAYIEVLEADLTPVTLPPINTSLCNFIRGAFSATAPCTTVDATTWAAPPNARCEGGTCNMDCTPNAALSNPTACNAWRLSGGFAAQGVTIR